MASTEQIFRVSFIRIVCLGLNVLVGLFMLPFLVHHLGARLYGLWVLIGTVLVYYDLLDLGIFSAIQRFVARALGKQSSREANLIINTSLLLFSITGLAIVLISVFLAFSRGFLIIPRIPAMAILI